MVGILSGSSSAGKTKRKRSLSRGSDVQIGDENGRLKGIDKTGKQGENSSLPSKKVRITDKGKNGKVKMKNIKLKDKDPTQNSNDTIPQKAKIKDKDNDTSKRKKKKKIKVLIDANGNPVIVKRGPGRPKVKKDLLVSKGDVVNVKSPPSGNEKEKSSRSVSHKQQVRNFLAHLERRTRKGMEILNIFTLYEEMDVAEKDRDRINDVINVLEGIGLVEKIDSRHLRYMKEARNRTWHIDFVFTVEKRKYHVRDEQGNVQVKAAQNVPNPAKMTIAFHEHVLDIAFRGIGARKGDVHYTDVVSLPIQQQNEDLLTFRTTIIIEQFYGSQVAQERIGAIRMNIFSVNWKEMVFRQLPKLDHDIQSVDWSTFEPFLGGDHFQDEAKLMKTGLKEMAKMENRLNSLIASASLRLQRFLTDPACYVTTTDLAQHGVIPRYDVRAKNGNNSTQEDKIGTSIVVKCPEGTSLLIPHTSDGISRNDNSELVVPGESKKASLARFQLHLHSAKAIDPFLVGTGAEPEHSINDNEPVKEEIEKNSESDTALIVNEKLRRFREKLKKIQENSGKLNDKLNIKSEPVGDLNELAESPKSASTTVDINKIKDSEENNKKGAVDGGKSRQNVESEKEMDTVGRFGGILGMRALDFISKRLIYEQRKIENRSLILIKTNPPHENIFNKSDNIFLTKPLDLIPLKFAYSPDKIMLDNIEALQVKQQEGPAVNNSDSVRTLLTEHPTIMKKGCVVTISGNKVINVPLTTANRLKLHKHAAADSFNLGHVQADWHPRWRAGILRKENFETENRTSIWDYDSDGDGYVEAVEGNARWLEYTCPKTSLPFFFDRKTGQVQWEFPPNGEKAVKMKTFVRDELDTEDNDLEFDLGSGDSRREITINEGAASVHEFARKTAESVQGGRETFQSTTEAERSRQIQEQIQQQMQQQQQMSQQQMQEMQHHQMLQHQIYHQHLQQQLLQQQQQEQQHPSVSQQQQQYMQMQQYWQAQQAAQHALSGQQIVFVSPQMQSQQPKEPEAKIEAEKGKIKQQHDSRTQNENKTGVNKNAASSDSSVKTTPTKEEAQAFLAVVWDRFSRQGRPHEYMELLRVLKKFVKGKMKAWELCKTVDAFLYTHPDLQQMFLRFVPAWVERELASDKQKRNRKLVELQDNNEPLPPQPLSGNNNSLPSDSNNALSLPGSNNALPPGNNNSLEPNDDWAAV